MEVQPVEMASYPSEDNPLETEEVCCYAAVYLEQFVFVVVNALIKNNLWTKSSVFRKVTT